MGETTDEVDLVQWLAREIERHRDGPVMTYIRQGHSVSEAAKHFSLPEKTVNRVVRLVETGADKQNDKPCRLRERYAAQKRIESARAAEEEMHALVRKMCIEGHTLQAIAAQIKRSEKRTRILCHSLGVRWGVPLKSVMPRRPQSSHRPVRGHKGRVSRHTDSEIESFHRRSKISGVVAIDKAYRPAPKVTLPHVSILDGVEW